MSSDEARWVLAHEAGIDLRKYGLTGEQLDRVRNLRRQVSAHLVSTPVKRNKERTATTGSLRGTGGAAGTPAKVTPASRFGNRGFHPVVVRSSRKLYVDGHPSEAIRKAFQSVNNRVKKLSGATSRDGQSLMSEAFRDGSPALQMSALATQSDKDEHSGLRFAAMGGIAGMRNPRSHDNEWPPDADDAFVLDALSYASLLHRFLDRCEGFASHP